MRSEKCAGAKLCLCLVCFMCVFVVLCVIPPLKGTIDVYLPLAALKERKQFYTLKTNDFKHVVECSKCFLLSFSW